MEGRLKIARCSIPANSGLRSAFPIICAANAADATARRSPTDRKRCSPRADRGSAGEGEAWPSCSGCSVRIRQRTRRRICSGGILLDPAIEAMENPTRSICRLIQNPCNEMKVRSDPPTTMSKLPTSLANDNGLYARCVAFASRLPGTICWRRQPPRPSHMSRSPHLVRTITTMFWLSCRTRHRHSITASASRGVAIGRRRRQPDTRQRTC